MAEAALRRRSGASGATAGNQAMASLIALIGRAFTALLAGLAANVVGSFVKGLIPLRAGRAGRFTTTNFAKPGRTNRPFFLSSRWPMSVSDSMIALTCLREVPSPTASVIACRRALLLRLFFPLLLGFAIVDLLVGPADLLGAGD